jgi:hypothetical protein
MGGAEIGTSVGLAKMRHAADYAGLATAVQGASLLLLLPLSGGTLMWRGRFLFDRI